MGRPEYLFGGSAILLAISRMSMVVLGARMLGPVEIAPWPLIQAIVTYSGALGLGVIAALGFRLPIIIAEGDTVEVDRVTSVGFSYQLVWWMVSLLVAAAVYFIVWPELGFIFGIVAAVAYSAAQFFITYLRSLQRFGGLILSNMGAVFTVGVGSVALVYFPSFTSLFLVYLASIAAQGVIALYACPRIVAPWRCDFVDFIRVLRKLHSLGLVLLMVALSFSLLLTFQRWVVLVFEERELLGIFVVAAIAGQAALLLQLTLSQIHRPRILFDWGRHKDITRAVSGAVRMAALQLIAVALMLLGAAILLAPLVDIFLPEYKAGVVPAILTLFGFFLLAPGSAAKMLLQIKGQHRVVLRNQAASVALGLFCTVPAAMYSDDLTDIIAAALIAPLADSLFAFASAKPILDEIGGAGKIARIVRSSVKLDGRIS